MVSEIIRTLGNTYYPHELPPRKKWDTEFNWWDDERVTQSTLMDGEGEGDWCQDCAMKPATGANGLCDECWEWHKKWTLPLHAGKPAHTRMATGKNAPTINYAHKPDYGQTRIIKTSDDAKKVVKEWKKKKKKKFGFH